MHMSLLTVMANLFYPPTCPACGVLMKRDGDWCPSCLTRVWHPRRINRSQQLKAIDACYCLADYDGVMRRLIHDIKYKGREGKCRACRILLDRFPWPERLKAIDMVVPVPLAPEKLESRGFNQVESLFKEWADDHYRWADILQRLRPTEAQWHLPRSRRSENVHRAFGLRETADVREKHILLVDDIFTTGATLNDCAAALKRKGAAEVIGLVMASGAP